MSTALRLGAIRLACLHPDDRMWVLENLLPDEREQVEKMLEEIDLLGLAKDPSTVEMVMREAPSRGAQEPFSSFDTSAHPFWLALGLMALPENERSRYVERCEDQADLTKWQAVFAQEHVPAALALKLTTILRHGDEHERA